MGPYCMRAATLVLVEVVADAYSASSNMSNVLASSTRPAKPNIRCRHGLAQGEVWGMGMGMNTLPVGFSVMLMSRVSFPP